MDKATVEIAIKTVIAEVQAISGYSCPDIKGSTRPAKDVEKFTSEVWPAATAMIAAKIGKDIPPEENIFYNEKSCLELTLNECVQRVMAICMAQDKKEETDQVTQ